MDAQNWLLLTDYASKYRISVSTLRRRIKSHQIPFRFENGKYFLLDEQTPSNVSTEVMSAAPLKDLDFKESNQSFSAATKLLNELKAAYTAQLNEKEQQLVSLKEEVTDLKMLVRVLEEDNDRMRTLLGFKIPNS